MCPPHRIAVALVALSLAGCASARPFSPEAEELLVFRHNPYNEYLLMVYRHADGQTRHVLRQSGVCELVVTYEADGPIRLKVRGERERTIDIREAARLTLRIDTLINAREEEGDALTSI
ncbi:MAG: hypothetical protein SH809_09675 [Rhodothermales bacterium]|nr:hypothetical protein [Rhodothermales bacterium]